MFMDSRIMIFDSRGHAAGSRPGFLFADGNEAAEQARDAADRAYDAEVSQRWQSQRWQSQPSNQMQSEPQTFGSAEAARAAAYAEYSQRIQERWRSK